MINDKENRIILNILISFIVSFKFESEKLCVKYLLEQEKLDNFLRFASLEIKTSLLENKKGDLMQKFKEIAGSQILVHNKINIFKL